MTKKVGNGLDLQGQRIQGLGDGSGPNDAVNFQQLLNYVRGLSFKEPVRFATTGNINLAAPGTGMDGGTLAVNDAFLAKDQTTAAERGIYVFNGPSVPATRRNDADNGSELRPGVCVTVTEGTANGDKVFQIISDVAITIGATAMTWGQLGGGGQSYSAGNGIQITGSLIAGLVKTGGGLTLSSDGFAIDTAVVSRKIAGNMGNGSLTVIPVTHNLGSKDIQVSVRLNATDEEWIVDWVATDLNTVTFTFPTPPAAGAYRFVVQG